MFWAPGDRGVCPLPPDLAGIVWLVHFGQTHAQPGDGTGGAATPQLNASCFDAQRGVVTPPLVTAAAKMAAQTWNGTLAADGTLMPYDATAAGASRTTLLFFAGGTRMAAAEYSQARCVAAAAAALCLFACCVLRCAEAARLAAPQGVRQKIWTLFHNRSADGYQIHEHARAHLTHPRTCLARS
jgi:hypothetical protein